MSKMADFYIELEEFGMNQMNNQDSDDLVYVESEYFDEFSIVNPFMDEDGRNEVEPISYYGEEAFLKWVDEVIEKLGMKK